MHQTTVQYGTYLDAPITTHTDLPILPNDISKWPTVVLTPKANLQAYLRQTEPNEPPTKQPLLTASECGVQQTD